MLKMAVPHYSLSQFSTDVVKPENAAEGASICSRLSMDAALMGWCSKIEARIQAGEAYWDLACAMRQIADGLQPRNFLEIGVRLGRSSAMVAATVPEVKIAAFDLWVSPYAGLDNPGPDFVRKQLVGVGHRGELTILNGDSRQTVPQYLADHRGTRFDIVNVDGDHSDEGAWIDLTNVAGVVAPGGYLLFDDLTNPNHTLLPIWRRFQEEYGNHFEFVENLKDHYGTGVARRKE